MILILSVVIIILITINIIFKYFEIIKEYVRFWILVGKLPPAFGKGLFCTGHILKFIGLPKDKAFLVAREIVQTSAPVNTFYFGPAMAFVGIMGPDELEATLSPMKHLEKSKSYQFLHHWLEEGLLTSSGAKWQSRRKILTPGFHFSILLDFIDIFNRETENFIKAIEHQYLNKPVDIVPLMSDFTLVTLSETSMGTKLDLGTKEGLQYKNAVQTIGNIIYQRFLSPWLWHDTIFDLTNLRKKELQTLNILHNFTEKIIRKRSDNFKTFDEQFGDNFPKRKHPLLDILLNAKFKNNSIDDIGIREEVDTFMFEGHDTTAMCLNFTTMLLACHKEIQEEVYQEIISFLDTDLSNPPSYSDLQQMALLERCIKESLRLYPPVPLIGRTISEDIPTKYGVIPKGVNTITHIYDLHRNPDYWSNPDVFDPSRHLPENSISRHPFAYIPFSAGPKNCIGQRFAMLEIKTLFCGLLRKFILEPIDTPESILVAQDMVLRPYKGLRVKFVLRNK